jgi:hypothetical protein
MLSCSFRNDKIHSGDSFESGHTLLCYLCQTLFNKPMLNKRSCLAAALGVTELITAIALILITLCCA